MQDPIELPSIGNTKIAHLQHYFPELFDSNGQMKPPPMGQTVAQWITKAHRLAAGWNTTHEGGAK